MNRRREVYWQEVEPLIGRLLSLQDREPFSPTYGSFDRKYWHQRFTDFPSASLQQGVETLALLYDLAPEGSPYRRSSKLLEWIEAGVMNASKIQNHDGSFDEWYHGERGWAGPTAYILNSLFEAHRRTGENWSSTTQQAYRSLLEKATRFLSAYEERDVLSNHQALALVAIYQSYVVFKDDKILRAFEKLWKRFIANMDVEEGWSLEYDGADPGYQTATLSFMARLHRSGSKHVSDELIQSQLRFLAHFAFPGGSFADGLGSRGTSNVFFFGFEYWSRQHPLAARLASFLLDGLHSGKIIRPRDQEDHYLIYRLPEFLLSMEMADEASGRESAPLPWEQVGFQKHLANSGHYFYRSDRHYAAVYLARGGFYRIYDHQSGELAASDYGVSVLDGKRSESSVALTPKANISINGTAITLKVPFTRVYLPVFRPLSFLAFKALFWLGARHPRTSFILKSLIRQKLMFAAQPSPRQLLRRFEFRKEGVQIHNQIEGQKHTDRFFRRSQPVFRFVPQSRYFLPSELRASTNEIPSTQWEERL